MKKEKKKEGGCSSIEYISDMRGKMGEEHRTLVTQTIRIPVLPCAVATDHESFPFLFLLSSSVVCFWCKYII